MTVPPTPIVLAASAASADDLLRFWCALFLLLGAAKVLGSTVRRFGQPAVVGELTAGVLLGPSLLGRLAPDAQAWLFPAEGVVAAMVAAVAWLGVVMLLAVTGFEVDLPLLRRLGGTAVATSVGSLVLPLAAGFGLGVLLPAAFAGEAGASGLPLFMGVALGISSLPVVAKVLRELDLARAGVGQVLLAASMVNDVVGWALLGVVAGVVSSSGASLLGLVTSLGGALAVIVGGLTIGQRGADWLLRQVRRRDDDITSLLGVSAIIVVGAGAVTQALGIEAVLGAFVAGMVLSRSPLGGHTIEKPLSQMADHVLAPVFFATAGLQVDVVAIFQPEAIGWTAAILTVAVVTKVVGGGLGAKVGGFGTRDSLAVGIGLNARGALEIVVAQIGLSLGVLSNQAYSAVVVMAVATSLMAPPLMSAVLGLRDRTPGDDHAPGGFASMRSALMPTRGGASSVLAGRLADAVLPPTATITALTVHRDAQDAQAGRAATRTLARHVHRPLRWRDHVADDAAAEVLAESVLGYDLLAVGATADQLGDGPVSSVLRRILTSATVPVLLVRTAPDVDPEVLGLDRIVVGVTGSGVGDAAVDLAVRAAAATGAALSLLHVIDRPEADPGAGTGGVAAPRRVLDDADDVLAAPRDVATRLGLDVEVAVRSGARKAEELVHAAAEVRASLLVVGAERRTDGSFLGHTVTYLLTHAPMSVAVLVTPRG